jgi:DNA-binding beta-propeller fold protein YncE
VSELLIVQAYPLTPSAARALWLQALAHTVVDAAPSSSPSLRRHAEVCVAAVLGDPMRRVSVLGGRDGIARSLGSVLGAAVTRFLGGLCGVVTHTISMPGISSFCNGVAVSRDGTTLLVSDYGGTHAIHEFSVADGSRLRVIGRNGRGPLQFSWPRQLWVASDGFVFVADTGNRRVQVLTPRLDFHGIVGVGELSDPSGVCANADVVVVSEGISSRVSVFSRGDGALLRRFGSRGSGVGMLRFPCGMCFVAGDRHVAIADNWNARVCVFGVNGEFIRCVAVGATQGVCGVVAGGGDDLVVADSGGHSVRIFDASGRLWKQIDSLDVTGVATHGGAVFAISRSMHQCVVLE